MFWLLGLLATGFAAAAASSDAPSEAAPIRLNLVTGILPTPSAPALSSASSDSDLDAAFAQAQARSIAARAQSEQDAQAKLDDTTTKVGEVASLLGPYGVAAGVAFKALCSWGYDLAKKFAHLIYGDPGWNSDANIARAKQLVSQTLAMGFLPVPFDDSLDAGAEGYGDRLAADLAQLGDPSLMSPNWPAFLAWLASPSAKAAVDDAAWLGLFPATVRGTIWDRSRAAALGRLVGIAFGRDPSRAAKAAAQASDAIRLAPLGSDLGLLRNQDMQASAISFIVGSALAS